MAQQGNAPFLRGQQGNKGSEGVAPGLPQLTTDDDDNDERGGSAPPAMSANDKVDDLAAIQKKPFDTGFANSFLLGNTSPGKSQGNVIMHLLSFYLLYLFV